MKKAFHLTPVSTRPGIKWGGEVPIPLSLIDHSLKAAFFVCFEEPPPSWAGVQQLCYHGGSSDIPLPQSPCSISLRQCNFNLRIYNNYYCYRHHNNETLCGEHKHCTLPLRSNVKNQQDLVTSMIHIVHVHIHSELPQLLIHSFFQLLHTQTDGQTDRQTPL